MPPTFGFDGLIKGIEDNIGEQRGDDAALRSTLRRDADDATVTNAGFEEGLQKTNNTTVCDTGTDLGYHNLVVNSVEEGGDVRVNDAAKTILSVLNCGCDSVVGLTTGSESETTIREMRIEDRRQDLVDRLLTHAVDYNWNTQRALLLGVGRLGDVDSTNRMGFEAVFHELTLKLSQVSFCVFFEGADSHPIEAMGTFIGADLTPSGPEVFPEINFVDKRVSFKHRSPLAYYTFAIRRRVCQSGRCFHELCFKRSIVVGHGLRNGLGVQEKSPRTA